MPIDAPPAPRDDVTPIAPSAPAEVAAFIGCCACSPDAKRIDMSDALMVRCNGFWDDGLPSLTEIVLLADRTGHLEDEEVDGFLARLAKPVHFDQPPALETETETERDAVHKRLGRLASDRRLRSRLVGLVGDAWEVIAPVWDAGGRSRVDTAAATWSRRLAEGADPVEFLPEDHIARREPRFADMTRNAQRDGRLRVNPIVAARGHIIALPGSLSIAAEAPDVDPTLERRRVAQDIADELRTLADPTRLTILFQLAAAPAAVSELARALHIAQPTASVHLRRLREAGLVTSVRDGSRVVYSAEPGALDELVGNLGAQLGRSMGGPGPGTPSRAS